VTKIIIYVINTEIQDKRSSLKIVISRETQRRSLKQLTGRSDYRIMIVTNDFHMFRAKILARHNGFTPYGITAPTNPVVLVNSYIREYFAVVKSIVFDINWIR